MEEFMNYKVIESVTDLKQVLSFVPDANGNYAIKFQDIDGNDLYAGLPVIIIPDHETKQIAIKPASQADLAVADE
jgi:hypothetical protein